MEDTIIGSLSFILLKANLLNYNLFRQKFLICATLMFLMLLHFFYLFPWQITEFLRFNPTLFLNCVLNCKSKGNSNFSGPKHSKSNILYKKDPFCLNTETTYCLLCLNSYPKKCKFNQMLNYCSWDIVNKQIRENVKGQEEYYDKQYTVILDAECLKKGLGYKKKPVLPGFLLDRAFLI